MNGYWKWIATTAVGVLLVLLGGAMQRTWSDRALEAKIDSLELQLAQLTVTIAGDGGYGYRIADLGNRLRDVERRCL